MLPWDQNKNILYLINIRYISLKGVSESDSENPGEWTNIHPIRIILYLMRTFMERKLDMTLVIISVYILHCVCYCGLEVYLHVILHIQMDG